MKKIKFLTVALVAMSMFSCTNEDTTANEPQPNGKEAVVTFQLEGTTDESNPNSRAPQDGTAGTEAKVNNLVAFFFSGEKTANSSSKKLVGTPKFVTPTNLVISMTTTTSAKSVYVIANTDVTAANFATSIFKNVKTLADLEVIKGDLFKLATTGADTSLGVSTQVTGKLWMSGSGDIIYGSGVDVTKGSATVPLFFVPSKIVVRITDDRTNKNLVWSTVPTPKATIADENIALLFSGAEGSFFGTSEALKVAQTKYYSGFASKTTAGTTVKDSLQTRLEIHPNNAANDIRLKITNKPYHFYVFPQTGGNTPQPQPIIVTIQSRKRVSSADTDGSLIYYPVMFNATDGLGAGKTFESGKLYNLNIRLTGDVSKGDGSGGTDPEIPITDANISVTVTAAAWPAAIVVNKTFD